MPYPVESTNVGFTQAGVGAAYRDAQSKMRESVSLLDFAGDAPLTDYAPALNAAIDHLLSRATGGELIIPAGVWPVKSRIAKPVTAQQHIAIRGQGRYVSTLDFAGAAELGLFFNSTTSVDNQKPTFEFSDFGMITSRDAAGSAIEIWFANANNIDASLTVRDMFVGSNIDRISDSGSGYGYWTRAVVARNARNGEIRNLHAIGELQKSPGSAAAVAINDESTAFVISDSLFLEWNVGLDVAGTCEGVYTDNTDYVFCRYGIIYNIESGAEPQLTVDGCSFNTSVIGVWANNVQQSVIANSLFYACAGLDAGSWPEWRGILLRGANASRWRIVGNIFAKENQRTGDLTTGIDVEAGTVLIDNNNLFGFPGNPMTWGVQLRAGAKDCRITSNNSYESCSTRVAITAGASKCLEEPIMIAGSVTATSGAVVSFPNGGFPNGCQHVSIEHVGTDPGSGGPSQHCYNSPTATGFTLHFSGGGSRLFSYVAFGN